MSCGPGCPECAGRNGEPEPEPAPAPGSAVERPTFEQLVERAGPLPTTGMASAEPAPPTARTCRHGEPDPRRCERCIAPLVEYAGLPVHVAPPPAQGDEVEAVFHAPLHCPRCEEPHHDAGEWATRKHHTHRCLHCAFEWRVEPYTFGVPISAIERSAFRRGRQVGDAAWRSTMERTNADAYAAGRASRDAEVTELKTALDIAARALAKGDANGR